MSGFVKLDCDMLDSSLWVDRDAREVFITALLMAKPLEAPEPLEEIAPRALDLTGFTIPAGRYGFVGAAGPGIVRRAGIEQEQGMGALERLAAEDAESRSPEFGGRRLIRVAGGYVVLNYDKYREKDYTNAIRQRRYRDKQSNAQPLRNGVTSRKVTHAEAEAEAERDLEKRDPESGTVPTSPGQVPKTRAARSAPKAAKWVRCPESFQPDDKHRAIAAERGLSLAAELENFKDHEFKDPKTDAAAAFRTWLRRSVNFQRPQRNGFHGGGAQPGPKTIFLADGSEAELYESR